VESGALEVAGADFEDLFEDQYARVARVIARVVRDTARAEELAVEVFWKLWRTPAAQGEGAAAWLSQAAVRVALDELRRTSRRSRYERLCGWLTRPPTPEDVRAVAERQTRVRTVLAAIPRRDSELLILRSDGLSYAEVAGALGVNPASVGTLLSRAQQAFRKEFVRRYGEQRHER